MLLSLIFLITSVSSCINYNNNLWSPRPHVAALILARGGSKGIPLKNLSKILGRTLINITLSETSKVGFSSVWVSTDHEKIAREARGVNVHWRSSESATDDAPSILGVLDFISWHPEVDVVALVQCTSPFIKSPYLERGLNLIFEGAECVFSVTRSFKLRWSEKGGKLFPANFNPQNRPRRQDWNGELVENGMFYFAYRRLLHQGVLQNDRCKIVEVPQSDSLEIDNRFDLVLAEKIYE